MATLPPQAAEQQRIISLDIIRGFAVMGILILNIQAFALPQPIYYNPVGPESSSLADRLVWTVQLIFFDGKMRTLFALLFGASTLLVIERAQQKTGRAAATHYARMLWLLAFGLAHFLLLWWGDILTFYAIYGLLLFFFRNLKARTLMIWGIVFYAVGSVLFGLQGVFLSLYHYGLLPPEMMQGMEAEMGEGIDKYFGYVPANYAEEVRLMTGSYATIVDDRFGELGDHIIAALQFLPTLMGTMLIGMSLFRSGFLTGERDSAYYRRMAGILFAISLPPTAILAWWIWASNFDPIIVLAAAFALPTVLQLVMGIGWAALMILAVRRAKNAKWPGWIAHVGRMAFTNYLGTSIVMTTIFYGYGLGLFASVSRAELVLFVLGMWLVMVLFSNFWLARFRYGPFEWIWRSLARGNIQPMRRTASD